MITFYGNGFSPFSRKISLALEHKRLEYTYIDGLAFENHDALAVINPRVEVPTLEHDGIVVTQSAHIAAYLDEAFPQHPIFPEHPADRVTARALEHLFGTTIDAALVNCSLWTWANREDQCPAGLKEAAQVDINSALAQVEAVLSEQHGPYAFGREPGIVEFTLWPHIAALRPLGFVIDESRFANVVRWFTHMRQTPLFREDAAQTAEFLASMTNDSHERTKIAWRGDRIEWMLARGYHDWLHKEIKEDRVIWPI